MSVVNKALNKLYNIMAKEKKSKKNNTDKKSSVEKNQELRVIKQYPDKEGRVIRFYGVKNKGEKEYYRVFRIQDKEIADEIKTKEEAEKIFEEFVNLER